MSSIAVLARQLRAVEEAHDRLDLTYREIARALRADESTLHRWRAGDTEPSPVFLHRLEILGEFLRELTRTFRSDEAARDWLDRNVPDLDGRTPREVLVSGRMEWLTALLLALNTGMTS